MSPNTRSLVRRSALAITALGLFAGETRCSAPDTLLASTQGSGGEGGFSFSSGSAMDVPCGAGQTQACYEGPTTTRNVGTCKDGLQSCEGAHGELPNGVFGACEGAVSPATEACNGLDDDCNGAVDEGCPCKPGTQACGADAKWGSCAGEQGPTPEVCGNSVDDDCNGAADDGCGGPCDSTVLAPRPLAPSSTGRVTTFKPSFRWELPAGTTGARVTLCHDRACTSIIEVIDAVGTSAKPASDLAPGVVFWKLEGKNGATLSCAPSPVWEFTVGPRNTPVDASWGTELDVNGDGYADVAIGERANSAGRVFVYHGGPTGLSAAPTTTLTSPSSITVWFAYGLAGAGDVNGDGYADLVAGSYGHVPSDPACTIKGHTTDEVYIYLGGPSGLSASAITIQGPQPNTDTCTCDFFGFHVAAAGDVNGDGYADVLVGGYVGGQGPLANQTWIFYGSATGVNPAGTMFSGGTKSGNGISGAGDINGDGFADVVVGSSQQGTASAVFMGSAAGLDLNPVYLTLPGFKMPMRPIGLGDINGDGYADVVQTHGTGNTGDDFFSVHLGSAAGISNAPVVVTNPAGFGATLLASGDMNGDGFSDMVAWYRWISWDYEPFGEYLGSSGGLATSPATTIATEFPGKTLFIALTGAGDVNKDGYDDLLIGSHGNAALYLGGMGGLSAASLQKVIAPAGTGSEFGASLAGAGAGM
jgi:hypothetical protein